MLHTNIADKIKKIVENMNKATLEFFENMPFDREFEKLREITKNLGDNARGIAEIADSDDCSTTSKASAACFAASNARQNVQNEVGLSLVA